MKKSFDAELIDRGLKHTVTQNIGKIFDSPTPIVGYIGFDPTAESLTVGHLAQINLLALFQKFGHIPIVVIGGATGFIGDPSGKSDERKLLSKEVIQHNVIQLKKQFEKFLNFDPNIPNPAIMLNNYYFYENFNVLDFLREAGKLISVNSMLAKDSVKTRLETGLSFTEFSYQILQGYDFKYLCEHYNCTLQMGGSDQYGNMTTGIEMINKTLKKEVHAWTTPLLLKADGTKYGKTEEGAIWLDPKLTTPYKFYQFWLNSSDDMIGTLLYRFSIADFETLYKINQEHFYNPEKRIAQIFLAEELTYRVHGLSGLESAKFVTEFLFNKELNLNSLSEVDCENISKEIQIGRIDRNTLESMNLKYLLVKSKLYSSNSDVLRSLKEGSIYVNNVRINDVEISITNIDLFYNKYLFVNKGKKGKCVIVFEN